MSPSGDAGSQVRELGDPAGTSAAANVDGEVRESVEAANVNGGVSVSGEAHESGAQAVQSVDANVKVGGEVNVGLRMRMSTVK